MEERLRRILSRRPKQYIVDSNKTRSAVMIPVYCRGNEYCVVFTKRTDKVKVHKNQMSFPGGVYEAGDRTLINTALRESEEEIGLKPSDVKVIGELDDYVTKATGYIISPFVAIIPWPYRFQVDEEEIEYIIEVPITTLLDKNCLRQETEVVDGETVTKLFYHCFDVVIWGATARILNQFLDIFVQVMNGTAQHEVGWGSGNDAERKMTNIKTEPNLEIEAKRILR